MNIIQSIDRKIDLEEVAKANGMEFDELLDELEAIVYSGTKINIDYFVEEVMDEDSVEDIYDFLRRSETGDIDEAMKELDGDFSEEEIRLIRVKFMSEMAN